jgi:hypothetical protein
VKNLHFETTSFCIFCTLYGENSQYHTVVTAPQRRTDGEFRPKEGVTQDERLPGAEAILSECAGFLYQYCWKFSMTVDFSLSLKFLAPENFICTRMTIPYYLSSLVEDFTGNGLFRWVNLPWPWKISALHVGIHRIF